MIHHGYVTILPDDDVSAVWFARGGYGTARLLDRIPWRAFARRPKPLIGYSDLTALLAAVWAETGVVGFHGPMLATPAAMDAGQAGWTLQRRLLTETAQPIDVNSARVCYYARLTISTTNSADQRLNKTAYE